MLKRPESSEFAAYYASYIQLVTEGDLTTLLKQQGEDLHNSIKDLTETAAEFRYGPDKWSIKEVLGHMADVEHIMSYRLLRIARGDNTVMPGFDENAYVMGASFDLVALQDIIDHLSNVRASTLSLLKTLAPEAYLLMGSANGSVFSARALAYVIAGHALHHQNILVERYLL
jgi:uncharacterized damage-inducible protein DinB